MTSRISLLEDLPVLQRLALSYAPAAVHAPWLALLALDARLAGILRGSREPMLAQLRFAWWREQLKTQPSSWPSGEPLLAVMASWDGQLSALEGLVDGWEAMTGTAPLPAKAFVTLAEARGAAFSALAELVGVGEVRDSAARLGTSWGLADLAPRLSHPEERTAAFELARARDWRRAPLPRKLRPLAVLHGLAARTIRRGGAAGDASAATFLAAMRLGLLGR